MRVKLSKNGEEIISIDFKAHEPFNPIADIREALRCLATQFQSGRIPNADAVINAFIAQNTGQKFTYIAELNGEKWKIDAEIPFCQACKKTEVDREGDLCWECRRKQRNK